MVWSHAQVNTSWANIVVSLGSYWQQSCRRFRLVRSPPIPHFHRVMAQKTPSRPRMSRSLSHRARLSLSPNSRSCPACRQCVSATARHSCLREMDCALEHVQYRLWRTVRHHICLIDDDFLHEQQWPKDDFRSSLFPKHCEVEWIDLLLLGSLVTIVHTVLLRLRVAFGHWQGIQGAIQRDRVAWVQTPLGGIVVSVQFVILFSQRVDVDIRVVDLVCHAPRYSQRLDESFVFPVNFTISQWKPIGYEWQETCSWRLSSPKKRCP